MRGRERTTNLELFANNLRFPIAGDSQLYYSTGTAPYHRLQFMNCAEIDSQLQAQQVSQFLLPNHYSPTIEICRLLIEVGKDFAEHISIFCVAVGRWRIVDPQPGIFFIG